MIGKFASMLRLNTVLTRKWQALAKFTGWVVVDLGMHAGRLQWRILAELLGEWNEASADARIGLNVKVGSWILCSDVEEVDITAQRSHLKPHLRSSHYSLLVRPLFGVLGGGAGSTGHHTQVSLASLCREMGITWRRQPQRSLGENSGNFGIRKRI